MADMVKAAVQVAANEMELREFPKPKTGAEDGLLRVEACGICGSDVETFNGHLRRPDAPPSIPGHEFLGIVEEIGENAAKRWGVEPGDRVAVEILIPCGKCERCLGGQYMWCLNRQGGYSGSTPVDAKPTALMGGFAEYVYLHPNAVLHKVRKDIAPEIAVMYNPLGAGVRWAADIGGTKLGDTVLILGAGQRGLAAVIAAKLSGAATIVVTGLTKDAPKLALAKEFGATYTIDVEQEDTVSTVMDITAGRGCNVVLDVTPMATQPIKDAVACVAPGGRIVLAGLKGPNPVEIPTGGLIGKGASLHGAFGVNSHAYAEAIRIIETESLPLEKLHTHTFGLDDAALAIETLAANTPEDPAIHISVHP